MSANAEILMALRDGPHTSVSAVRTYLMCPAKFAHRYEHKTEASHRSIALALGISVHEALAVFYSHLAEGTGDPPVAVLLEAFSTCWRKMLIGDPPVRCDDVGAEQDKGVTLLETFHREAPRPAQVLGVEIPFGLPLCNPDTGEVSDRLVVGALDALAVDEQGRTVIIESKTAARSWPAVQLVHDPQVTIYRMAVREMGLADDPVLQFHFLKKTKTPSFEVAEVIRTTEQEVEVRRLFWQVLKAVDHQIFYPVRSWACGNCEYGHACNPGL